MYLEISDQRQRVIDSKTPEDLSRGKGILFGLDRALEMLEDIAQAVSAGEDRQSDEQTAGEPDDARAGLQ